MNEMNIECPSCGCEVPVTEVLQSKLESTVRQEMQTTLAAQRKQLSDREDALQSAQEELKNSTEQLQKRVNEAVEAKRSKLAAEMLAKARESVQVELTDRDEELSALKKRVKDSEQAELDLRRRERELKEQADRVDIEVEQKVEAGRKKLSQEMLAKARELMQLELTDRDEELSALKKRVKDSEQAELDLRRRERELKEQTERIDIDVERKVEAERKKLSQEMLAKGRESMQLELTGRDEELSELKKRIKESESAELDMRRRERELNEKAERVEIEVERKMEAERVKARVDALQQADEKYELKTAEKDKQIADMRKKIDELRRKSEQTSQQLQGEVQELALEERLRNAFPLDIVDPVGKGRNGADVGQTVCDPSGQPAGKIIFESKRTAKWYDDWLPKIREDLRQANADVAVIVTETMPEGLSTIGCIDGVWVCRWDCAVGLTSVIRNGLIEVAATQKANANRGTKVEMLYDYFAGNNFRNRISGVVEAFQTIQKDLIKEKAATQRRWAKQERELDRAVANMAGLYGDFQGIVGEIVPALESFEPLKLESDKSDTSNPSEKDAA